ncbi:FAD:protein FMN transferase [Diaphorobacter ruginosibacter]|uniref:FAD:protein FMN transferase n=1 Tax=Diaphorobacter ruginosibacter TaxID=1715720 RepID=UPI003341E6E3
MTAHRRNPEPRRWQRRAQPALGTLVEIGISGTDARCEESMLAAFAEIAQVQRCMSRFDPASDVSRFAALRAGESMQVAARTAQVLCAAQDLADLSKGLFDVTQGRAPAGWRCDADGRLFKLHDAAVFDLGGIAKGYAVDAAVRVLQERDSLGGWVNAGGDVRAFGAVRLPLWLRDEREGRVWPFARLEDGAFSTSWYGDGSRSELWQAPQPGSSPAFAAHVSVAAPQCLWADALTKIVAASGDAGHPLLARFGAQAWLH